MITPLRIERAQERYTYHFLHIPTSSSGERTVEAGELTHNGEPLFTRAQMLEAVNSWNRAGAGTWQYWLDL